VSFKQCLHHPAPCCRESLAMANRLLLALNVELGVPMGLMAAFSS